MVAYRSENNKFTTKENYKDLNLTLWPNNIDTRDKNPNMKGFTNIGEGQVPDYVMAEYVNSLGDAVMAIQRSIGVAPMLYVGAEASESIIENSTVSKRIARIESGLFDERYGGTGWENVEGRPTLNNHSHTGKNGHPKKIDVTEEITGKLPKHNIDLSQTANGLTSDDISMSRTDKTSIQKSVEDKLSKSIGGTIAGPVVLQSPIQTTNSLHQTTPVMTTNSTKVSDNQTKSKQAIKHINGKEMCMIDFSNLDYGYYAIAFRMKKTNDSETSESIVAKLGNSSIVFKGEEVKKEYKQLFWVIDHNSPDNKTLTLVANATNSEQAFFLDNVVVSPTHPAILDR